MSIFVINLATIIRCTSNSTGGWLGIVMKIHKKFKCHANGISHETDDSDYVNEYALVCWPDQLVVGFRVPCIELIFPGGTNGEAVARLGVFSTFWQPTPMGVQGPRGHRFKVQGYLVPSTLAK